METQTNAKDIANNVSEKFSDATGQVKEKAAEFGRATADKIDMNRGAAASSLESAATTLRQKADSLPGGEKVTGLAHTAADKLTSTAEYLRQNDVSSMMTDIERLVKNNPGQSLLAAAVIGFLAGRTFTSND